MPVTSAVILTSNLAPEGYTPDTPRELTTEAVEYNFGTDIAVGTIPDADPAVAMGDLAAAVRSWFETDFAINVIGVDTTNTVEANIHLTSYARVDRATSPLVPSDVVYRVAGTIRHERTA